MRFFSNDSDDARDQSNVDVQTRNEQINDDQAHGDVNPDHVQSDPVAVPQQRSGSPWSDAPGTAADDEADRSDNSDTVDSVDADRGDRADHETSDAVDLPLDDKDTDVNTDTVRDTDDSVHDDTAPDDTAALTTTTYGPDGTVVTNDETDADADTDADEVEEMGDPRGFRTLSRVGDENSTWICADFVDVVLHVFGQEARMYYDLDSLWGDGRRVDWREPGPEPG